MRRYGFISDNRGHVRVLKGSKDSPYSMHDGRARMEKTDRTSQKFHG